MFGILYKYACRSKSAILTVCRCRDRWRKATEGKGIHHGETETEPQSGLPGLPGPAEQEKEPLSKTRQRRKVVRGQEGVAGEAQGQAGSREEPQTKADETKTKERQLGCPICGSVLCLSLAEEW